MVPLLTGVKFMSAGDVENSVTEWITYLKQGDSAALEQIWRRYYGELVRLAARRISGRLRRTTDEDDVVASAFHSLYRGAVEGKFPKLDDRQDLWKLLVVITARKVHAGARRSAAHKRGANGVLGERSAADWSCALREVAGREPTPQFAAEVADEMAVLLDSLNDDVLRQIAVLKLNNASTEEIGRTLNVHPRTVQRKLDRIRRIWSKVLDREDLAAVDVLGAGD